ncbi:MAG: hypothetical protein KDJ38_16915, partial [Gammaproteobacteria bacterium]|nr:hypothetical protein [Gammaproteobacteria bacterium]
DFDDTHEFDMSADVAINKRVNLDDISDESDKEKSLDEFFSMPDEISYDKGKTEVDLDRIHDELMGEELD